MAKKRTAQLEQEIREALSRVAKKPSIKTREQLDAEIDAVLASGLGAERYEVAQALGYRYPKKATPKKMTLTGTNLFALTELVLKHGVEFPNRLDSVDFPHIKRTMALGLVEPVNGDRALRLTDAGREQVADEIEDRLARERSWKPRENTLVRPVLREEALSRERRERDATIEHLERALRTIRLN